MNGELYQIASIVAAGKKAMRSSCAIRYDPLQYENSIRFDFLPSNGALKGKKYVAPNVPAWFAQIKENGVQDIKLLCPYSVKNRHLLGFSNTTESSILCFHKYGKVTFFTADWQFDAARTQWNILYSEHEWPDSPSQKPQFDDNTASFRRILSEIKAFAAQIECGSFADIFDTAIRLLDGSCNYPDKKYGLALPQIPQRNLQIFEAASIADVFGAMGSWNDSPPCMAHQKGLDDAYEALSAELFKNIRLAILYAINEW